MVEHKSRFNSFAPSLDGYDEDFTDTNNPSAAYKFGRSARDEYTVEPSIPLFLSDPDGEPEPEEFAPARKRRMASVSSKILMAVVAASGVAMLFAWFSSDATRDIIVNAKASIAASIPTPSATAQADAAQLTSGDLQLKDPVRSGAPLVQPQAAAPAQAPVVVANVAPSREDIANAYQSALQSRAPVAAPAAPQAAAPSPALMPPAPAPEAAMPPVKRIEPQELAVLMKRAKDMLAMGDIPAARLLLERAAEGQEASAALMLARTYDPTVLGTSDVRNITPEPDKARAWYQKAAQLGSPEAQRLLAQLPN
jgi:TPR repeat protein